MNRQKLFAGVVMIALILGNAALMARVVRLRNALSASENTAAAHAVQNQVVAFTRLFIEKVLKAEGEVDFETRLKLETEVRALNDEAILQAWQRFTESETEAEAQAEVKNLLTVLVEKFIVR